MEQINQNFTFERVWQMFQETDKKFNETDKKLRSLEKLFTGQWGKLMESLVEGDLIYFLDKMQNLKTIFPEYTNNLVYGAIAYLRSESDAHIRTMLKGLFVIRATGKSASIINPSDFLPTDF